MELEGILKVLEELKPELKSRYKVKSLAVFGSYVRGEQRETSDVDVLVEFSEDADLFDLIALEEFLTERLGIKVDVVPKNALRKELRQSVFREAIEV
ncbi:nucleotidyltransferase family protein [Thermococcus sp. SY098]|uniref:nucleotidyltransferase family protein n=1 Tax=Thermococcus sp. SY098 TaxID=3111325 RepID=UPI002D78630C|nr:nucleotidyltransferase family protein [Thermococcus sp. SY098]WRS53181.1 nucleotidyltransferase family protein [Thermococcus sp. SY098]